MPDLTVSPTVDAFMAATTPAEARAAIGALGFGAAITGRTGGGASNLDGQATAAGALVSGTVLAFARTGTGLEIWQLTAGTESEDALSIIRPDDYHADTNARTWKRIL